MQKKSDVPHAPKWYGRKEKKRGGGGGERGGGQQNAWGRGGFVLLLGKKNSCQRWARCKGKKKVMGGESKGWGSTEKKRGATRGNGAIADWGKRRRMQPGGLTSGGRRGEGEGEDAEVLGKGEQLGLEGTLSSLSLALAPAITPLLQRKKEGMRSDRSRGRGKIKAGKVTSLSSMRGKKRKVLSCNLRGKKKLLSASDGDGNVIEKGGHHQSTRGALRSRREIFIQNREKEDAAVQGKKNQPLLFDRKLITVI